MQRTKAKKNRCMLAQREGEGKGRGARVESGQSASGKR